MTKEKNEIDRVIKMWPTLSKIVPTIHSEKQYNIVVNILDELIESVFIENN